LLSSLALARRRAVLAMQELSGRAADTVHLVGSGAGNDLVCQLTADACELRVIAGTVDASAVGNILAQARALGAAPSGLDGMRTLVRGSLPPAVRARGRRPALARRRRPDPLTHAPGYAAAEGHLA
jgi:rhamnulokinase